MPNLPGQTAVTQKKSPLMAAPLPQPGAMTNLGGLSQPVQPGQIQAPNLPGSPAPPPFNYTAPTVGPAPVSTPFGAFTAPGAGALNSDPGVQFRLEQANRGANRSAAARGTLLSGGFQTALAKLNQGLASQEYGNLYNRALSTYGANRDTNQQNYGQSLAGYQAGTGAALDAGRLGLAGATAGYDRAYGAQRDTYGDQVNAAQQQTGALNANTQAQSLYAQQMADYRAQVEAQRQADTARQNAETTRMQGTPPPLARLPGQSGLPMRNRG
jgi:hypothetical protein